MEINKPWEQLARYFAGELSAEEHKQMESWIKADPDREIQVTRLQKIWEEAGVSSNQIDIDKAWDQLSEDIDQFEMSKEGLNTQKSAVRSVRNLSLYSQKDKSRRPATMWRGAILVAATILTVVLAGLFSYQVQMNNDALESAQTEKQVFETNDGERATYVLSDGSKVILHAGSRLEVSADYNREIRELFLEGEAYFETTHDPEKPFVVHSEFAYTKVLGTRFLVQSWPESDNKVEVVVSEGKVALGDNHNTDSSDTAEEVLITRNKMGVLTPGQNPVVSEVADMNWYIGWTEGRLEFENRALREVVPRLERWYNIDIRVEKEQILEKKITAEIDYSHSMTEVLQGIALTLGLEIEKKNRTVTFFHKK
jgi:ferric-dicitrate binding protein FerR (iron transport regulator)